MVRTETATVVFTDVVGSTELANRLGHDAYEAMRRAHFNALRFAASQCQGTEIKSTGDGMVFSFSSAGDALACMIRMQQTTDLAARRNGGDPRIRIGASCGEINREDPRHLRNMRRGGRPAVCRRGAGTDIAAQRSEPYSPRYPRFACP